MGKRQARHAFAAIAAQAYGVTVEVKEEIGGVSEEM